VADLLKENLERDLALQRRMERFVDLRRPAPAEERQNPVRANFVSNEVQNVLSTKNVGRGA
jgi:hypothetical protein